MTKNLTLEQIGKMAGVSRSTVSRVVNDQDNVKPEVRDQVLKIIAETGYRPHPAARSLAGHKSQIIGLVIPETAQILFTDPYFPGLIQGMVQTCYAHDYTLSLFLFHATDDEARLPPKLLRSQLFDGVIVIATHLNDPLVPRLIANQVPFVQVGYHEDTTVSFVDADNLAGAYTAVKHLIQLGHQRIGLITGLMTNRAARQRQQGYLNALREFDYPIDEALIVLGDFTEVSGYEAMQRLLPHQPDAVFVSSDSMTYGALRALQKVRLVVPDDVALVGFDDLPMTAHMDPPLTTVRQPIQQTGIVAVETLIDMLENGHQPARRTILPTQLIVRASCGC